MAVQLKFEFVATQPTKYKFIRFADIAYIPKSKVLVLSKMNRVPNFFSKRLQMQKRLAEQIHAPLRKIQAAEDLIVRTSATHFCVKL